MPSGSVGSFHREIVDRVFQSETCHWCECRFGDPAVYRCDATFDHLIPRSHGGSNVVTNLVRACDFCNGLRGVRDISSWGHIARTCIRPYRDDLPRIAEALYAGGFKRLAISVEGIHARAQEGGLLLDQVDIRYWPLPHAGGEFRAALPMIRSDHGVDWFTLTRELRRMFRPGREHNIGIDIGHDMTLRTESRLGWFDGTTFALVDMIEWKAIRTMQETPEAMEFRRRSLGNSFQCTIIRHQRDRLATISYGLDNGKPEANPTFLYATSGAAALRIQQRVTDLILKDA